jgi:hypothetical protein
MGEIKGFVIYQDIPEPGFETGRQQEFQQR